MRTIPGLPLVVLTLAGGLGALPASATVMLLQGADYLVTQPGTVFGGVPFVGDPVGPGNTDTIVHRLSDADITAGPASISTQMTLLQMKSATIADFGLGLGICTSPCSPPAEARRQSGRMTYHSERD